MSLTIRPFCAGDLVQLDLQPSQHLTVGILKEDLDFEDAEPLLEGEAWTACREGRVLACYGIAPMFLPHEGVTATTGHGFAWALLGVGIGADHLALTRAVRAAAEGSAMTRIDAMCRPRGAEIRWLELIGFEQRALLRRYGPSGEDLVLFDRVRES